MDTCISEIKQAVREIERNLVLLSTDAGRDLRKALKKGHEAIEEFDEYSLVNIINAKNKSK